MKKLLLFLLLLPLGVMSQSETPFKNASAIVIESDSADLRGVVAALTAHGYGIQSSDKDLGTILTTVKPLRSGAVSLQIHADKGKITIRGNFHRADLRMPLEYKGAKGSPLMRAWEDMEAVARTIPGPVSYR